MLFFFFLWTTRLSILVYLVVNIVHSRIYWKTREIHIHFFLLDDDYWTYTDLWQKWEEVFVYKVQTMSSITPFFFTLFVLFFFTLSSQFVFFFVYTQWPFVSLLEIFSWTSMSLFKYINLVILIRILDFVQLRSFLKIPKPWLSFFLFSLCD